MAAVAPGSSMLIVGYGTMAAAMVHGWLAAGLPACELTIYNPRTKPVPDGVAFTTSLPDRPFERVLLAFKPQVMAQVAPTLAGVLDGGSVIISVLAGVELARLRQSLPGAGAHVRFMPNLAAAIGKSASVLIGTGMSAAQREDTNRLALMLGTAEWLDREDLFNIATALAGSGPGFVYRFIDALARGAANLGIADDQARRMAVQMMRGAAELAAGSDLSPGALAARVASRGGMTQAGLDVLDRDNALDALIAATLRATADRGAALNQPAG